MFTKSTNARLISRLTAFADQNDEAPEEFVVPEDLSGFSGEDLKTMREQAVSYFDAVYANVGTASFTSEDMQALSDLTDGIEKLQAAMDEKAAEVAALAEQAAALAVRAKGEPKADEEPPAEEIPVEDEIVAEAMAEVEQIVAEAAPVVASADKAVRVNLSRVRASRAPAPARTSAYSGTPSGMVDLVQASGDGGGFAPGQGVDWLDMGKIVDHRLSMYNSRQYEAAARANRQIRQSFAVATFRKPIPDELTISSNDPMHVESVLRRAMDQSRLPHGSLTAAGGWCAPSETLYDLCELETREGIISLPEVGVARGGINRTLGPDFASIYGATGFSYTEAEDIDGDYDGEGAGTKPCYTVACTDFEDIRLNVMGVCINAGLLQARGYPELIARVIRGALVAHDHRLAAALISGLETGSTAVSVPATYGAAAPLLQAIEMQVEHMKYVNRLGRNATVEAVFPFWVRGAIRSDLALRLGVDLLSVPDSRIDGWFRERGIAPQFVYNWQDLTGAAGGFTAWPSSVKFLLYPAGTWVKGGTDVIRLETLYDSTLLGTNDYTALFSEEGWLVAKMCHDSRVVTVPFDCYGATAAGVDCEPIVVTTTTTTTAAPTTTTTTTV